MAMVPAQPELPSRNADIGAPDGDYLTALRRDMEDSFRAQDQQIDRLRELRSMSKKSPVPQDLMLIDIEIRDPTIADEIQRVVATLVNQPPKLSVDPGAEGDDKLERNATNREHFTEEVLRIAGRRGPGPPTMVRLADAVAGDGGGCTKLVWMPDVWDERYKLRLSGYDATTEDERKEELARDTPRGRPVRKETKRDTKRGEREGASYLESKEYRKESEAAKKAAGPPFAWTAVDIRTVYPIFSGGKIGEVIEVSERAVSSTFRRYRLKYDTDLNIVPEELAEPTGAESAVQPGAGDLTDNPPASKCTWIEHWDDEWVTYYVGGKNRGNKYTGQVVDQWRHGYGRHPYFFTLGFMPAYWSNRKVGWSISETKRWLVEFRSYLWTIFAQQMARDTLPPVSVEIPENARSLRGSDGTPKASEKYKLGQMYYGEPGEKRTPWQFPNTTTSLKEMIALTTEMIDRLGTPRMEQNVSGIEASGFAINQVLAEARLRFDPLATAMEDTLEDVTRFLWHLIRAKVGETVWVYGDLAEGGQGWLGLGPKELSGDVRIEWKLDPTLPSAALVESRYWTEQVKMGFASMDQAIRAQGRNPDEVRFGQTLDRMRASDWYKTYQEQYVVSEIGRGDLLAKAWSAKQLAETGQMPGAPPGQGQPGAPGAPQNPNAVAGGAPVPAGMGSPGLPDMAAGSIAPNQQGANGVPLQGSVPGQANIPSQSAGAGVVQPMR